eukprot:TRINITY_DN1553_c3_g1_i2.p1 TRINITY_DN1553_c3_g1~~TRINITY_DN1553_c3_g1_i2.p1  ORF type:complete len:1066 (-),score=297.40 TRINITY_DN1553_c3_g1_i2:116-3313(-)
MSGPRAFQDLDEWLEDLKSSILAEHERVLGEIQGGGSSASSGRPAASAKAAPSPPAAAKAKGKAKGKAAATTAPRKGATDESSSSEFSSEYETDSEEEEESEEESEPPKAQPGQKKPAGRRHSGNSAAGRRLSGNSGASKNSLAEQKGTVVPKPKPALKSALKGGIGPTSSTPKAVQKPAASKHPQKAKATAKATGGRISWFDRPPPPPPKATGRKGGLPMAASDAATSAKALSSSSCAVGAVAVPENEALQAPVAWAKSPQAAPAEPEQMQRDVSGDDLTDVGCEHSEGMLSASPKIPLTPSNALALSSTESTRGSSEEDASDSGKRHAAQPNALEAYGFAEREEGEEEEEEDVQLDASPKAQSFGGSSQRSEEQSVKQPVRKGVAFASSAGSSDSGKPRKNFKPRRSSKEAGGKGDDEDDSSSSSGDSGETDLTSVCSDDDSELSEKEVFWLSPIWYDKEKRMTKSRSQRLSMDHLTLERVDFLENHPRLKKVILNPDGSVRQMWDLVGVFMFAYDAVTIPLLAFDLPQNLILTIMPWIVRLFWTVDFVLNFLTGAKKCDGTVDNRPRVIARDYMLSWFMLDFVVLLLDWLELVTHTTGLTIARVGKIVKNIRLIRMVRSFKLYKNFEMPQAVREWLINTNDITAIVFGIFRVMTCVIWVTHAVACVFYTIAEVRIEANDTKNWVHAYGYQDAKLGGLYSAAFIWALARFNGEAGIYAQNSEELAYTSIVTLLLFVVSTSAVSSITTKMTQLELVGVKQSAQFQLLDQYLRNNKISKEIGSRVVRNARHIVTERKKNAPEDSVELLQLISEPLLMEVHYEMYRVTLIRHAFFDHWDFTYPAACRQLCHTGIQQKGLHTGDILFQGGDMPETPKMYFLVSGSMLYARDADLKIERLEENAWACEACFWVPWEHQGTLRSKTDSWILAIDAQKFQTIAKGAILQDADLRKYGKEFVKHLNSRPKGRLSDLKDPTFECELAAKESMPKRTASTISNLPGKLKRSMSSITEVDGHGGSLMEMMRNSWSSGSSSLGREKSSSWGGFWKNAKPRQRRSSRVSASFSELR